MRDYRYRKGEYTKNSTKGKSLLQWPETYKNDAYVQVWLNSNMLATLSKWLDEKASVTRFLSEVIRTPLEMVLASIVESGEVEFIEDTTEARDMIWRKYRVNVNPRDVRTGERRGAKNILHNMLLSEKIKKGARGPLDRFENDKGYREANHRQKCEVELGISEVVNEAFERMEEEDAKEMKVKHEALLQSMRDRGLSETLEDGTEVFRSPQSDSKTRGVEIAKTEIERPAHTVSAKAVTEGDTPRLRTEEELSELEGERAQKDREQMEEMDKAFEAGPDPSRVVDESSFEN